MDVVVPICPEVSTIVNQSSSSCSKVERQPSTNIEPTVVVYYCIN